MTIARTGVYVDDYLEYSSTLSADLQRLLSTTRELDQRAEGFISLASDQTKYYVGMHSHSSKRESYEDDETEHDKMKNEVKANQEYALNLCTEKVMFAKQAYYIVNKDELFPLTSTDQLLNEDLKIERHMKRLDEDLNQFAELLKQEGETPEDEPAILPPLPLVIREENQKRGYITPQLKRIRKRNMDLKLMPPPRSHKKSVVAAVDADEPTYCVCNQVSYGEMIACDNENCEGGEWFHYSCVGLIPATRFKRKWFCPICRQQK